jgi:hypothetical protein
LASDGTSYFLYGRKSIAYLFSMAIAIYVIAIGVAFLYVPLALILIALPAAMYFLPERSLAREEKI